MLQFDSPDMIEGVAVYKDDKSPTTFYALPSTPRFRLDERGLPVFKYLKYRLPVDRPDGKKGGGFIIFDSEFVVPADVMKKIKEELEGRVRRRFGGGATPPPVRIATITPKRGSVELQFLDKSGVLVQGVRNPASPGLMPPFITPFTVELTPEGAAVAEAALQGQGGAVQIVYSLPMDVKLPPITAHVWFNASKFMSFKQKVDKEDNGPYVEDSYSETLRERFSSTEAGDVRIDPGGVSDPKVIGPVTEWAWKTLEDGVKRMIVGDIPAVSADDRKVPDGYENVWRDISVEKLASFSRTYTQGQAMEWDPGPRGTLPNITSLKGPDGKPLKWENFAATVDADDKFFKQLNVVVRANVEYEKYNIHSVRTHIEYKKQGGAKEIKDFTFTKPEDMGKFAAYIDNDNTKYTYWYEVSYKGASKTFKSPPRETEELDLIVNVDDSGVLAFSVIAGDLDFETMRAAQVTVQYEDKSNGVPLIEQQFTLDQAHPEQKFLKVIFQPIRNKLRYKVKYILKDGKEYQTDWVEQDFTPQLIINDMWAATRTVGVRATGDLENRVEAIFLDLEYRDETNKYSQTKSVALNQENPFVDWAFPVITETGGKIVYSGTMKFRDGTSEEIPAAETTKNTILVGPQVLGFLEVEVMPDLIDFDQVKLAKLTLRYADPAHGILDKKDVVFKAGATDPVQWKVELKDKTLTKYEWSAVFFMADGSKKTLAPVTTDDETILPQLPE